MWFTVVFILLLLLCGGILIPSWFDMDKEEKPKRTRRSYKWDGPKTDARINRMLSESILRNTLIHELIHTVPDGMCHTGEWKKWAKYVSAKTGYNIKRLDGDETEEDLKRLEGEYN